jgi:hypothetical protein
MWTVMLVALGAGLLSDDGSTARVSACRRAEACQRLHAMTRITPDEAKPFVGEWTSRVEGPSGPINFLIDVKVEDGKVLATITSDLMGESTVQDITSTGKEISLRYTAELWGYSAPVMVILVPHGDWLDAEFALMNRQFEFSGIAIRKQPITAGVQPELLTSTSWQSGSSGLSGASAGFGTTGG